ncbi:MAG: polyprenol monophosphomannose synthase [Patescibacteria group bacterium]
MESAKAEAMNARVLSIESLNDCPAGAAVAVIPTYNESDNINELIEAIGRTQTDIFFVDDASPDGTAERIREAARKATTRVWLMKRSGKLGLGTAYVDAFGWLLENAPHYDVLLEMDADFSHEPAKVPELVRASRAAGVSVGSRYVPGGDCPDWPWRRRWLSHYANVYARVVLGLRFSKFSVHDATAGFVAWRRDVLEKVLARRPGSNGYAFQIETKLFAALGGHVPVEVPIVFRDRRKGRSKISRSIVFEAMILPWKLLLRR